MVRCVVFDLDGVVAHGRRFSERLHKEHRIPMEKILPFFEQDFPHCLVGKADMKQKLLPYLPHWGFAGQMDDLLSFWFHGEAHIDEHMMVFIQELRAMEIPCYIATNNERHRVQFFLDQFGFDILFDDVFSSARLGAAKPDQLFYARLFSALEQQHGISKGDVLFLDDDLKNVEGAAAFGFVTHHYRDFPSFSQTARQLLRF